jgi:ribosomal protein L40E
MRGLCSPSTGRLWSAPFIIIIGSILVIFDPEYGGAIIAAGVLLTIWLVVRLVQEKREKQSHHILTGGQTLYEEPDYQQQNQYQPIQQPVTQAVSTSQSTEKKYCSKCGAANQTTDKFCYNCGNAI